MIGLNRLKEFLTRKEFVNYFISIGKTDRDSSILPEDFLSIKLQKNKNWDYESTC